jgi:hypothetical protein
MDTFESLIWTERYYACGDFEVHSSVTDVLRNALVADNYLWSKDSEHVMIIEDIQIESDVEDGGVFTVTGRSLESILERRIVYFKTVLTGSLQDGIERLLNENAISPSDPARTIPNLIFERSDDNYIKALTVDATFYGEDLYEVIQGLCEANKLGFKIVLNANNQFVFKLYVGTDRSYDQMNTPYVIFSPQFDNIINSNYLESKKTLKTFALIAGSEKEDGSRTTVTTARNSGAGTGLNRREMFVDGGGISTTDDAGKDLTEAVYKSLLVQKGREELALNIATQTFEGEVETSRLFQYGEDFFKGDIVQVTNEYGVEAKTRIVEFVISQDVNGIDTYPTFETIVDPEMKRGLPDGYVQVEYIESTGAQYFKTGFIHDQNTRIVMDVQVTKQPSTHAWLFEGRTTTSSNNKGIFLLSGTSWRADYASSNGSGRVSISSVTVLERLFIDYDRNTVTINNFKHTWSPATFKGTCEVVLFAANTGGTIDGYISARSWLTEIYNDGVLVRDYVPCISPDGVPGFYDMVNRTFEGSATTTPFVAGPVLIS